MVLAFQSQPHSHPTFPSSFASSFACHHHHFNQLHLQTKSPILFFLFHSPPQYGPPLFLSRASPPFNSNHPPDIDPSTPPETDDNPLPPPADISVSSSYSDSGVEIQVQKTGKNQRRIRSRIGIDTGLCTIWSLLTDYERLSEFIPGLAVSQLLDKTDNFARLYQIGQQNLAFGLKFNAKGIVECYEKELVLLPFGQSRDIEFKMVEGDFKTFQGRWSIVQEPKFAWNGGQISRDRLILMALEILKKMNCSMDKNSRVFLFMKLMWSLRCGCPSVSWRVDFARRLR